MAPFTALIERAAREPIRAVVAAPPQHGKSETVLHGLCWANRKEPGRRHAYASYGQERSERQSDKARRVAERDGQSWSFRREYWQDPTSGGSILWTSKAGQFTGEPVDGILFIDDPTKDRQEAESAVHRGQLLDWFDDVAEPRCHPTASVIVLATRWHPDDLSGALIQRGWSYLNLQALARGNLDADGFVIGDPLGRRENEPLCEARRGRDALLAKEQTNSYTFASLFQGQPRPRSGTVFREPHYYDSLPSEGYRVGYGVDLAYSAKRHADFSVVIRLRAVTDDSDEANPITRMYVEDVCRKQVEAPSFLLTLRAKQSESAGPMLWIASGTEKGTATFIQERVPLQVENASEDKYQRALPVSEAWNAGRIMVPRLEEDDPRKDWLEDFLAEVLNFTGIKDTHDDQVDALAAGHRLLALSANDYEVGGYDVGRRF